MGAHPGRVHAHARDVSCPLGKMDGHLRGVMSPLGGVGTHPGRVDGHPLFCVSAPQGGAAVGTICVSGDFWGTAGCRCWVTQWGLTAMSSLAVLLGILDGGRKIWVEQCIIFQRDIRYLH